MTRLAIKLLIFYAIGTTIVAGLLFAIYHVPVQYMLDLQEVQIVDDEYHLYRDVRFINLEARSRQLLFCEDGKFIGYRNTDWFNMEKREKKPIVVPFNLENFTFLRPSHCDTMYLQVQYYIRSPYFGETPYPEKLSTNTFTR